MSRKVLILTCLPWLWSAGASSPCVSGDAAPAPSLVATAAVDGRGVFLHDLVADPDRCPTNLLVARAPAPGLTISLSRAQIAGAVRKADPNLAITNWPGADPVRISRKLRPLAESELAEMLTATLQREQARDKGELEVRFSRPWVTVNVPDEPLTLRVIDLPLAGITPNFVIRFELRTPYEVAGVWQAALQVRLWRDVWVARSAQPRGRPLRDADLGTERRDLLQLREAMTNLDLTDPALELAESLMPGAPVLTRSVRVRPIVQRGKVLDAVVQEGALLITVKVEAMEDGMRGQTIRVRNTKSKREFHGKVENEQTVDVTL